MRLVSIDDDGKLGIRWTWLPYWMAAGPRLTAEMTRLMMDVVVINGMPTTEESLDAIDAFVLRQLGQRFGIRGLADYLAAIHHVREE